MSIVDLALEERVADTSILLVEDDHGDAVLVQACLDEVGFPDSAITWARTFTEALAVLATTAPGCILLDLGLPDADGYSAVREMVETVPDIAVIVLTGRQERDGGDALGVGAQDYLVKDAITGELLQRSIRYAMERKRAQLAQQVLREVRLSAAEQGRLERGLLPVPILRTDAAGCATYYRPGRDDAVLGGDFFDVVEIADGRVRAVIGDVMGHGPDEAALGVHLRVAWRTLLLAGVPDEQILPNVAKLLDTEQGEHPRYVTACDITIEHGTVAIRLAGHPAPVISMSDGAAHYADVAVGPPLGVGPARAASWPVTELPLPNGASIVLYTDGLLEAYQTSGLDESLGIDGLVATVGQLVLTGHDATSWIAALVADAPGESIDDTAAVVLTAHSGLTP